MMPLPPPPQFPSFPLPPFQVQQNAEAAQHPELPPQPVAFPPSFVPAPVAPPAGSERDRAAEEAIKASIEHVVHEYIRQDYAEQFGFSDAPKTSAPGQLECHVASPQHAIKVGVLLAVAFFGVLPLMNTFSVTVLFGGCTLVYVSDYLGYRKGSIAVLLFALGSFGVSLALTNLFALRAAGPFFLLLNTCVGLLSVVASLAIIQYRWLQLEFPTFVCFLERFSVCMAPIASLPAVMSINVAFLGSKHAPLGFAVGMTVMHSVFFSRLKSSFLHEKVIRKVTKEADNVEADQTEVEELVPCDLNGRDESILFTLMTLILPSVMYAVLQSNWYSASHLHAVNLLAMAGIPIMYLFWNPRKSLWFLRPDKATVAGDLSNDPFGIWGTVVSTRSSVLAGGYLLVLHWGVYRLLHSRFQYLFVGVPPPFNGALLLLAAYCLTAVVVMSKRILDKDAKKEDLGTAEQRRFAMDRVGIMLLSVAFALLIAAASGMPQFFYPMSALTASSFNAYLLDRRNSSNFTLFCCCSSLLLMWWMYRTFSFIVMDLHVLGEAAVVPTPVVAVSVLWCYLLGCIAFGLSFSENKRPFQVVMFFHAMKVAWVEHVLYSQKENGSYPAAFVYVTSGLGVWLCLRLYRNGVMDISSASVVSAAYIAKIFTFLAEVTGSYYINESAAANSRGSNVQRGIEVALGWWAVVAVAYIAIAAELSRRAKVESVETTSNLIGVVGGAAVIAFTTTNSIQRSFAELVLHRHLNADETMHTTVGTALVFFSVISTPILSRYAATFPFVKRFSDLCKLAGLIGLALFIVRPTELVLPSHNVATDVEILHADSGRIVALLGVVLSIASRFIPLSKAPFLGRALYWLFAATMLSVGLTVILIPAASKALALSVACFVFFSILTLDVCHYRCLANSEAWIVYAVTIASMVLSFVALGRVDLQKHAGPNLMIMWEMHETGRMTLLAVAACTNIFTAVLIKFRLSGKSLLPNPIQLTNEMVQQVGVIGNYATLLSVVIMTILNTWAGEASPAIFVASGFVLLLLVDDEMLFFELHRESYRYIPVLVFIVTSLWAVVLYDSWQLFQLKGHLFVAVKIVLYACPVLPSHISLFSVLWWGRAKGGTRTFAVLFFVVLDLLCLLFASRPVVQWMALVGISGQLCRLYEAQFWRKRHDALL